jgi:hypothetical protein
MRPSRSSARLAVPAFPDSYGPRYIRERSRTGAVPILTRLVRDVVRRFNRAFMNRHQMKTP